MADHFDLVQLELEDAAAAHAEAVAVRMDRNQGGDVRIQVDFEEIDVLDIVLEVVELNFLDQRGGLVRAVDQSHHLDVVPGEDLPGVRVDHDRLRFLALAVNDRRDHSAFAGASGSALPEFFTILHRNFIVDFAHGTPFLILW